MVKQDSWKRTDEIEIDLVNLLRSLCSQWKRAVLCGLAAAVLFGAAGWLKGAAGQDTGSLEQETGASEEIVLTEAEEQAVADAVRLTDEIRGLEEYLDSSVLMQLDPYHKNRYVMLYSIDRAQRQEIAAITESYFNFLLNGGAAGALIKNGSAAGILAESTTAAKTDKSCLAELIGVYQKTYSSPYQIALDNPQSSSLMAETVFYVEITGKDAASAKKMGLDLQDVLKEYSGSVKKNTGSHRLTLVSCEESETADSGLLNQQREKSALLSSSRTNLKAAKDAFSAEQMEVYKAASMEREGSTKEEQAVVSEENESDRNITDAAKYILLGLAGGIFGYCGIFTCWYMFSDTVKSTEDLKRRYVFPVYGEIEILSQTGNGRKTSKVSGMHGDEFGYTEAQVLNRIRLACKKEGITRLSVASGFSFSSLEKECLEKIAGQLEKKGIYMSAVENAGINTSMWDSMAENGNVLMVCRTGRTTHRIIDDAMNFYLENGINVIGAVLLLQNGENRT